MCKINMLRIHLYTAVYKKGKKNVKKHPSEGRGCWFDPSRARQLLDIQGVFKTPLSKYLKILLIIYGGQISFFVGCKFPWSLRAVITKFVAKSPWPNGDDSVTFL